MDIVTGYINHIIFHNSDNLYTVLSLVTEDEEELICVGTIPGADEGLSMEFEGEYVDHPSYGRQFKVKSAKEVTGTDVASMERYLGSGAIKGVGEALARRIIKAFGKDTFRIIEEEPERLAEIKGISMRKAQEIAEQMYEKRAVRDAFIFLSKYGISNNLAVKIYETYGDRVYRLLVENPYQLAEDIRGVGFKKADEIATQAGLQADSEFRIRCGILYTLSEASAEGHTYLPNDKLLIRSTNLLGLPQNIIEEKLPDLMIDKKIIIKNERIYLPWFYYSELNIARLLDGLNITMDPAEFAKDEGRIRKLFKDITKEQGIELDQKQEMAVFECIKNGVTIITGGPGTGKTTTINTIIKYFEAEGMDILLAAPTGRAAKRMQEATGYEACTIHRLLEVNGASVEDEDRGFFNRNSENPLEADVIIVDEMSMVDVNLFKSLLDALTIGTRLILVGDASQLPSVGPGQVLRDIMNSGAFSTVMLEHIFRQAEESDIVLNAHRINRGERLTLDNKSKDFFFLKREDPQVIYKHMVQLITEKLPGYVEATPLDIQVLTPMRKGPLGVESLNVILQKYLNPEEKGKVEYHNGERLFREGDKVMQIKNNYQLQWEIKGLHGIRVDEGLGVFNGDIGVIKCIDTVNKFLTVTYDENKDVDYPFGNLDEIELAYAMTIHKSQGSEYPAIIIPLLGGPSMLFSRNLIYTAVTRARRCVTILGKEEVLDQMIANERSNVRYTSLKDMIKEVVFAENI